VLYAVTKLNFVDVCSLFLYAMRPYVIVVGCVCVCVCVCVCLEFLSWWNLVIESISPGQELQAHTHTDGNDIRPHIIQEHNERTSTKFNLVTAQSTAHEPLEDGRKYGPKHVGASF
jgi:hypothetical protein